MLNRRCTKNLHKKYRRYSCDIWGRLAIKKKNDFITKFVYQAALNELRKRLRRYTQKARKTIWKQIKGQKRRFKRFKSKLKPQTTQKRKRTLSGTGVLLKLRRKISLYYGGGRIRGKTFRRYGRMTTMKKKTFLNPLTHFEGIRKKTYTSIIESRLDVLLLRSNFVDSVYKARSYVFNQRCKIQGQTGIKHPAFLIKNFQLFGLKNNYTKKLRKSLFTRIRKHAVVCIPSYLFVNFSLLVAFKIEDPIAMSLSYPFADKPGTLANFRKMFQLL